MEQEGTINVVVVWRGKKLNVEVNPKSKVIELGEKLQKLTNVRPDTLRLLVPQITNKVSKLITPFSDEHSSLSLEKTSILEGKPIRMMGVFDDEIKEVSQTSNKSDLRILGFDEEEKRLRQRLSNRPQLSLKLPKGTYIFCDFRTLHLPGIELSPPSSEALRRMHMLASDPGIIAIMNKHRWRVGIMTEMAPEGYVGISDVCLLGFNKNHGEEISLRLRTDDLKGFRKYENIKKTLLHELAHMVYSEHDANFWALNKQLNQEAASLDWTKSRSHSLSGHKTLDHYEDDLRIGASDSGTGQKLGGASSSLTNARASSVAAACNRFLITSTEMLYPSNKELPSDAAMDPDSEDTIMIENYVEPSAETSTEDEDKPDPDECSRNSRMFEPDPDDGLDSERASEPYPNDSNAAESTVSVNKSKSDPDDCRVGGAAKSCAEPDPDDSSLHRVDLNARKLLKPDPDDFVTAQTMVGKDSMETNQDNLAEVSSNGTKPVCSVSVTSKIINLEPDPDDHIYGSDSEVLQRIEEPVVAICGRIQAAIEMLKSEVTRPVEAISSLQTLFKIVRNVIEHPDEMKFRRLRKANPQIQRNVLSYKAAMEVLSMIGFCEDTILDEVGRVETYLVLKRNDPGLLWLAKSSLEVSIP